jgi:hypothetical protein
MDGIVRTVDDGGDQLVFLLNPEGQLGVVDPSDLFLELGRSFLYSLDIFSSVLLVVVIHNEGILFAAILVTGAGKRASATSGVRWEEGWWRRHGRMRDDGGGSVVGTGFGFANSFDCSAMMMMFVPSEGLGWRRGTEGREKGDGGRGSFSVGGRHTSERCEERLLGDWLGRGDMCLWRLCRLGRGDGEWQ